MFVYGTRTAIILSDNGLKLGQGFADKRANACYFACKDAAEHGYVIAAEAHAQKLCERDRDLIVKLCAKVRASLADPQVLASRKALLDANASAERAATSHVATVRAAIQAPIADRVCAECGLAKEAHASDPNIFHVFC